MVKGLSTLYKFQLVHSFRVGAHQYHHQPRAAGVFVPGLATATINGLPMVSPKPTIQSLPTLDMFRTPEPGSGAVGGSTDALASPPYPRQLSLSPSLEQLQIPAAQETPAQAGESQPDPTPAVPPPTEAAPAATPPEAPATLATPPENAATVPANGTAANSKLEGTVYTDGSYWKNHVCTLSSSFPFHSMLTLVAKYGHMIFWKICIIWCQTKDAALYFSSEEREGEGKP